MLPRKFLTGIAKEYGLSQDQTDVFLEKFSTKKSDAVIAAELFISAKTVDSRMGEVYKKFNFNRDMRLTLVELERPALTSASFKKT